MSESLNFKAPADQEWFEERAAILEYDALMFRPWAEAKAYLLTYQMIVRRENGEQSKTRP